MLGDPSAASRSRDPSCFGAAARDPLRSCENRKLAFSVAPKPNAALLEPSAPCRPMPRAGPPEVCAFGFDRARSKATFALVGDSHAVHWRATLAVMARTRRWRGLTLARSVCPFTFATTTTLRESEWANCRRWKQDVVRWFERHPKVHTVFVSQHSRASVEVAAGEDGHAALVAGFVRAWRALPRSVRHIVVIRDPPYVETRTLACVKRALATRKRPGLACALPRESSLEDDPAVDAAEQLRSPRVQVVDLTRFMCDGSRCFPVVGGVLVKKDKGHLTRTFAETLAPFLRRQVNRLMASWR